MESPYLLMSWLGHLLRLEDTTPARKALPEAIQPTNRKRGRPPTTWLKVIQNDLNNLNIDINMGKQHYFNWKNWQETERNLKRHSLNLLRRGSSTKKQEDGNKKTESS